MPYEITVQRKQNDGTLKYVGDIEITTPCWWDLAKRIPAGTYTGCSATTMATKRLNAVFIPNVPGYTGIFVHQGTSPQHSDGCIVVSPNEMRRIYADINPKNGRNVTVVISDV
jgi:hypothetical protein